MSDGFRSIGLKSISFYSFVYTFDILCFLSFILGSSTWMLLKLYSESVLAPRTGVRSRVLNAFLVSTLPSPVIG